VDSQLHAWNPATAETPSHRGWAAYATRPSFGIADAIASLDEAGVDRAVLEIGTGDAHAEPLDVSVNDPEPEYNR
jgi:predicted TIM-barrel fold metal-dependent hydrolase